MNYSWKFAEELEDLFEASGATEHSPLMDSTEQREEICWTGRGGPEHTEQRTDVPFSIHLDLLFVGILISTLLFRGWLDRVLII